MLEECLVLMIAAGILNVNGRGMFGCYGDCRNAEC